MSFSPSRSRLGARGPYFGEAWIPENDTRKGYQRSIPEKESGEGYWKSILEKDTREQNHRRIPEDDQKDASVEAKRSPGFIF